MVTITCYAYKESCLIETIDWVLVGDFNHGCDIKATVLKKIPDLKFGQVHEVV